MSNDYYTKPSDVLPLTTVRSADFNQNNQGLETAFDKLPTEADNHRSPYGTDLSLIHI